MAGNTEKSLRNQIIYSVFVRNYSKEGTFEAVRADLDRIRSLGTDIIWLMPINPVGRINRKGTLGSPYSISDYRKVNPEFGTEDDLKKLVKSIHSKGMKIIIDIVYNHTSRDSVLSRQHPEWFFHKEDGNFGNKTGDWWDVIDLDYSNKDLWKYQIDTLKMWAGEFDIDGFRCDVAPLVPVEFWEEARAAVESVHPGAIWLAESVEPSFVTYNRSKGVTCASDSELYKAFDICYDYDSYWLLDGYLSGRNSLKKYLERLNLQEAIYPDNYVKLRFLENHDRLRAAFIIKDIPSLVNWTAFLYFQKGTTLIYNGQEAMESHTPGLFDDDTISWNRMDESHPLQDLMRRMALLKKNPILSDSSFRAESPFDGLIIATHRENAGKINGKPGKRLVGFFSTDGRPHLVHVNRSGENDIPDGIYTNLVDGSHVECSFGEVSLTGEPVIIEI